MSRVPLRPTPAGAELLGQKEPLDWDVVFGRSFGPLELEIGCGAGGFAIEYCRRHPEVRYVAFEWRKKYAREVSHRASTHGLANLLAIEADARIEIPRMFRAGCLDVIRLQFPDPWWKRAHQKRAILQPQFARLLFELLRAGGRFDFRTDVEERGAAGLRVLEGVGLVNPLGTGTFHPFDPEEIASTRERRYLVEGLPVFRARLVKP
jgi:tRNA (guanine-N7-)-methyltransferase